MRAAADWRVTGLAFALGLLLLGLIFNEEVVAAVRTWDRSTAYNHCWLVLPVAIWLGWTRRHRLASLTPTPTPLFGLLAVGGALAWLVAERLGIMEGRQFVVVGLVWVLALAVFGWRVCLAMAGPLVYLVFLVPFGEFLTPWLQEITLWMIELGLRLAEIPHYVDGLIIELPTGVYLVAEACAGLRFIIAAVAFGALYALVMFRSPGRRSMVMVLAVVVPIVANGFRALGIVLLGHHLGSAEAGAADHLVYGWVFFSAVILLLVLIGLPFRQDQPEAPPEPRGAQPALPAGRLAAALALVLGLSAAASATAAMLDANQPPPRTMPARLAAPAGCSAGSDGLSLTCAGNEVTARLLVFPGGVNWSAVAGERRRAVGAGDDESLVFSVNGPGMLWQARQSREGRGVQAAAAWLDGAPAGDGIRSRTTQAWNALSGAGGTPVLAVVELRPGSTTSGQEPQLMRAILAAQAQGLAAQAVGLSRRP